VKQVWYVAYGSNLGMERFRCYLSGGRPACGMRRYAGCRDPHEPRRIVSLHVPGGLAFAGQSGVWGGGMAFYDAHPDRRVACRAYLVTADQFADITAQEMRRPAGGAFARNLADLLSDVESVHTMGPGRYETVTRLGVRDGAPMFTVTHSDVSSLEPVAPSAPYLRWISTGLREAHGWNSARVASYLSTAPGVMSRWTWEEVVALADQEAPGGDQSSAEAPPSPPTATTTRTADQQNTVQPA
jgi:hypothetical protein